jgi:hypothetical protein
MVSILHIGNGNEKHLGARAYDVGRKLQHGFIRGEHNALFFSDRDTKRTSGLAGTRLYGAKRCNQKLLQVVDRFRPDMILLGHATIITNETLAEIRHRHPAVRIAEYNVDALFRAENVAYLHTRLPYIDILFSTTDGEALRPFGNAYFIPNPTDAALETHRNFAHASLPYDVFFACRAATTKGAHDTTDRLIIPRYLHEHAPELRTSFHGFAGTAELFGARFYETLGTCAIGLNISQKQTTRGELRFATDAEKYRYSSDRISQYLGCGLLVCTERGFALETLFAEDKEMVFFSDRQELRDKLRYYVHHSDVRQTIAQRGWVKAHTHFNNLLVARYMIERTFERPLSQHYAWLGN